MANAEVDGRNRPKVVFIVGDNVGWGDISCYGGLAPTPRLDAVAAEGMRFRIEHRLEGARDVRPVAQRLGALQQTMTRYPNIQPGQDFAGYP